MGECIGTGAQEWVRLPRAEPVQRWRWLEQQGRVSMAVLTSRFLRWILKMTLSEDRNAISASSALTKGDEVIIREGRLSLTDLIHS